MTNNRLKNPAAILIAFFLLAGVASGESVQLRVTAELANIREKPDIGSAIIFQVVQGSTLEAEGKENEWYAVMVLGEGGKRVRGYVHESLVRVVETPSREEKKPVRKEAPPERPPPTPKKPAAEKPGEKPGSRPSAPHKAVFSGFSLSLFGGGDFVSAGSLNEGAEGLAGLYEDYLKKGRKGEISPLRLGFGAGAEIEIPLAPNLNLGLRGEFLLGRKESSVTYEKGLSKDTFTAKPGIRSVPVGLTISYFPFSFFYSKLGVEYHFTEIRYFYRLDREGSFKQWEGRASSQGFGFLAGLGGEWKIQPRLALFFETAARLARITGFKGTDTHTESPDLVSEEQGKLYSYTVKTSPEKSYSLLFIRGKKPSEADVSDPREAVIDLSGVRVRAGLKIRF